MSSLNTHEILVSSEKQLSLLIDGIKDSISTVKKTAADEAWKCLQLAITLVVSHIEIIAHDLAGKEKKKIAMESIANFYDKLFIAISIPFIPSFIEPLLHKSIKTLFMALTSSSIDVTVSTFRKIGYFTKKSDTNSNKTTPKLDDFTDYSH